MAFKTDMSKAKKKWEEERARAAAQARFGRPVLWWKPKEGTNKIRILPPWTDEGPNALQWWRELWTHYGVMAAENPDEDNAFTSSCAAKTPDAPIFLGVDPSEKISCRFCAHCQELRSSGDPANIEMAKAMRAKMRILANIIDLDDPVYTKKDVEQLKAKGCPEKALPEAGKPKIQVFAFGTTIMKDLLDFYQDNVDLADLEAGHDIIIEREGKDRNTDYRVRPNLKATKAEHISDEDLTDLWNLDQMMPFFTDKQQEMVLAGATKEEVYALTAPTVPEERQLASGKKGKKAEEEEPESSEEAAEEASEEAAEESAEGEGEESGDEGEEGEGETAEEGEAEGEGEESSDTPEWPPLDAEGNVDYGQLSDEQIEDPENAEPKDKDGFAVHVACFGKARQRNPKDPDCSENCGLFDRCGKRIKALDDEEAKKKAAAAAAAAKKGPGKGAGKPAAPAAAPAKGPGKGAGKPAAAPAAAKPAAGKPAAGKPAAKPAAKEGGSTSLEDEMRKALGKK